MSSRPEPDIPYVFVTLDSLEDGQPYIQAIPIASLDPVRFDPDDRSTWPRDGQIVAVYRRFSSSGGEAWSCLNDPKHFDDAEVGDLWLPLPEIT